MSGAASSLLREGNPNGYRFAPDGWSIDDPDALETFREAVIASTERYADRLVKMGYQGVVVWNISGEQYQSAKYYGEPRLVEYIAPEMDHAADDYFRILREHGLRVGVTIRPVAHWPTDKDGNRVSWENIEKLQKTNHNASGAYKDGFETYLDPRECYSGLARLHHKIQYAKQRWGATLFYIDYPAIWRPKTPDNWAHPEISPAVFRKLKELHPDVLLIPEDNILASWSAAAPYSKVPKHGRVTPDPVRQTYPEAFSVLSMPGSWKTIEKTGHADRYKRGLRMGDIPMSGNQFKVDDLAKDLRPILRETRYVVTLKQGGAALRGEGIEDAVSVPAASEALQSALSKRLDRHAPVDQRRVRIEFQAQVSPQRVRAAADAVGAAGGVVAWSEPVASEADATDSQ